MKKYFSKISIILFSAMSLGTIFLPFSNIIANADVINSQSESVINNNFSEIENRQIEQFISFDKSTEKFTLNNNAKQNLGTEKFNKVQQVVTETNRQIELAKKDNNVIVWVEDTKGEEQCLTPFQTFAYGKTDIKFYWNFARVYLSKGTVQGIGAGLTLGGIWVPEPIVSKVASSLGVGIAFIPHGIWFDYNYFIGVLTGNFGYQ